MKQAQECRVRYGQRCPAPECNTSVRGYIFLEEERIYRKREEERRQGREEKDCRRRENRKSSALSAQRGSDRIASATAQVLLSLRRISEDGGRKCPHRDEGGSNGKMQTPEVLRI